MTIKTFDHDVTGSSLLDSIGGHDPVGIEDIDLSSLPAGPVTVLLHRSPNLIPRELRIDPATVRLIQFCDRTLSLHELINKIFDEFNDGLPRLLGSEEHPLRA